MHTERAFASDFDGTIHFWGRDEPIGAGDLAAIDALRASGGLFGVCTGRTLFGLTAQSEGIVDFDFYITATGAGVFDHDLRPILRRTAPREAVRALYDEFAGRAGAGWRALVCAADDYWCLGGHRAWEADLIREVDSFDDIPGPFIGLAMGTATDEEATLLADEVNARYGEVLTAYQNLNSIDVVPAGCSKGTGLHAVVEHFGVGLMAGMGDSFNDLSLLEAADVAYTFRSSPPELRAAADVLADSAAAAIADFMARPRR